MQPFVNALALAILDWRWLLWRGDDRGACERLYPRAQWLVPHTDHNRSSRFARAMVRATVLTVERALGVPRPMPHVSGDGFTVYGSLDSIQDRRIVRLSHHSSGYYHPAAALMSSVVRGRFPFSGPIASRVWTLFSIGTLPAYGALYHAAFRFSETAVAAPTERVLCARAAVWCGTGASRARVWPG